MSYDIVFHLLSETEYLESYTWYKERQTRLGSRFEAEIEALLVKISNNPELFGYSRKPYREARLKSFPFVIIFKVNERQKRCIFLQYIIQAGIPKRNMENNIIGPSLNY